MKIRLSYGKWGKVRFLGHLDMARLWERGLRKASAPVAMSAGFTPRPKMSFGLALPTGAESVIELFDVTLDETRIDAENGSIDLELLRSSLTDAMPLGVEVVDVDPIAPQKWSLQEDVTATTWVLAVDTSATDPSELDERVAGVVSSTEIWVDRERKGERRRDDVRPGILDLRIIERGIWPATSELSAWADSVSLLSTDIQFVEATLTTSGRGVRPTEMAEVLRPGVDPWITMPRVVRTHQWIGRDDAPRVSARAGKDITHDHSLEQRLERRSEHSVAGSSGGYD
ncbi:MAG: TIGR03936 family radical SAM-associated protein [Ilumatobacteraceae bacterium]|nr:TIGR03936 family radical SAM-associated protein [Actinomycetota bacterium]MDA3011339.1 TIGR03936 family radical SAM-associated protein [Actinomycetota bacterium]MDA3024203.1 TIGR03936 family radical SAM-associated protein [Actinomycetota bacterium]